MRGRVFMSCLAGIIATAAGISRADDDMDIDRIIRAGDAVRLVAYLSKVKPNMDVPIWRGVTMLGQAANENKPEIARILLENGADVNAGEGEDPPYVMWGGGTALDHAAWMNTVSVAEVLIDHHADLNRHGAEHFSPLIVAARRDSEGVAKLLLEKGADPNGTDVDGNTALLEAADAGHQGMVEILVAHGADIEAQAPRGANQTALGKALVRGHAATAAWLISRHAHCDYTDAAGQTTLFMAASRKWDSEDDQVHMMDLLLQCGSDINAEIPQQGVRPPMNHTVLWQALRGGETKVASWLISHGARVTDSPGYNSDFRAAVAMIHDPNLLQQLVAKGAQIDVQDQTGTTPFLAAVGSNNEEAAVFLLNHGININETDKYGRNALHILAENPRLNSSHLFATLLARGANANAITLSEFRFNPAGIGVTPLHEAAFNSQGALVQLLLEHGANMKSRTAAGDTALDIAIFGEHMDVAQMLLGYGATLNEPSSKPATALYKAVVLKRPVAVQFLLDHHANLDTKSDRAETALHAAARDGSLEILDMLISAGADLAALDKMGRTPLHLAVISDQSAAVAHLLAAGASMAVADNEGLTAIYFAKSQATLSLLVEYHATLPFHSSAEIDARACASVATHANQAQLSDILGEPINDDGLKRSPLDDWDSGTLRWIDSRSSLRYEGRAFVVGFREDHLGYVSQLSDDKVEKVICEFTEGPPAEKLIKSMDPKLCSAALAGQLSEPDYSETVSLEPDASAIFTAVGNVAAKMDLFNEGTENWVVKVQYSSQHGEGCEEGYPGILRADRTGLDSVRTDFLTKLLPSCGSQVKPVVFNGHSYLDVTPALSAHPTQRRIVKIKDGVPTDMCKFSIHNTYTISVH